tara:strand:+ start:530 stop:1654 length:1125 start_codon:yes stop_codon:yes gene_type:complete
MDKLLFRKFFYDVLIFFFISSLCITVIIWIVQAVNYLDIVSEDGHGLKTYFTYTFLSLPKIFSRTIIFVLFISIFYTLNKYESTNEILVFWNNGIKKIIFINFILKISIIFIIIQLLFNLYIVPKSQNLGRSQIKESKIDFLPKLISEKKFIDVVKNLTIFIEEYENNGKFNKIYMKELIDDDVSKIISANSGKIIKVGNKFFLRLIDGGITNIENNNTYNVKFKMTDYDLSKFSTKTVTVRKIQETDSSILINCLKKNYVFQSNIQYDEFCNETSIEQIAQEMFKRLGMPFYILVISLVATSIILKPKNINWSRFYKTYLFVLGVIIIIVSQIIINLYGKSFSLDIYLSTLPFLTILSFYFYIYLKTKFTFNI